METSKWNFSYLSVPCILSLVGGREAFSQLPSGRLTVESHSVRWHHRDKSETCSDPQRGFGQYLCFRVLGENRKVPM
jgi:hypothetical protein